MITDNIFVCETRLSIVDWVYSKTQVLLETLKIQNQHQCESYVSLEVEHLFPKVACARSRRQCLTVPQNRRLILWMLVCEWTDSLLLTYRMWWLKCYTRTATTQHQPNKQREIASEIPTPSLTKEVTEMLMNCHVWITLSQTHVQVHVRLSWKLFKTTKQWLRWSPKAEVRQRYTCPEPGELRKLGCLTESTWTPKFKTPKTQLADTLTKGNFTRDEWNHFLRFFQHHEFLEVFLHPFSSSYEADETEVPFSPN